MSTKTSNAAVVTFNAEKRTGQPQADPRSIEFNPDNVRTDLGTDEELDDLGKSILESGLIIPLLVKRSKETKGHFVLVDGHRRLTAIQRQLEKGADIPYVNITIFSGSAEDELMAMLATGVGQKKLTDIEQAEAIKRLMLHNYKIAEIARKIGKSIQFVTNMQMLANVPKVVKDRIAEGAISGNTVVQIVRVVKDDKAVVASVEEAIKDAQETAATKEAEKQSKAPVKAESEDGKSKRGRKAGSTTKAPKPVVARAKNVTALKVQSDTQKLKELVLYLDNKGISNDKTDLIVEVIGLLKDGTIEELAKLFAE